MREAAGSFSTLVINIFPSWHTPVFTGFHCARTVKIMEFFQLPEVRSSWPKSMSKLGTDRVAQNGFENVHDKMQNYSMGDSEKTAEWCFFPC